jgi:hypothetical protein
MAYVAPSTVTTLQTYTSAAHNIIVNDIIDHETRLLLAETAWTTWTPSFSGVTVGNGSYQAYYRKYGKSVNIAFGFTLGSTSSITGDIQISLPAASASSPNEQAINVFFNDYLTASYAGIGILNASTIYARSINSGTAYSQVANCSSTVPFTWGTSDSIRISGTYFSDS